MARDLAKSFKEKALQHQQAGGKSKGSSKLTEAEKVEVRKEIAAAAGVSVGTLSHALEVLKNGDQEIVRARRASSRRRSSDSMKTSSGSRISFSCAILALPNRYMSSDSILCRTSTAALVISAPQLLGGSNIMTSARGVGPDEIQSQLGAGGGQSESRL